MMQSSSKAREFLTLLNRLARSRPESVSFLERALSGRLDELAVPALEVALETGDPMGRVLARQIATEGTPRLIEHLLTRLSEPRYRKAIPLREVALVANQKSLESLRRAVSDGPRELDRLARTLNNLGASLASLGRWSEALEASEEAVAISSSNSPREPESREVLAASLANLSEILSHLGRLDDASDTNHQVVEVYRQLCAEKPDNFRSRLARALTRNASLQLQLGSSYAASLQAKEAITLLREEVAAERESSSYGDLAQSLHLLGRILTLQEKFDEALSVTVESVELRRRLVQESPESYLHDLARSLDALARLLLRSGRPDEALAAIGESVSMFRRLNQERPEAFAPGLAASLEILAGALSSRSRVGDAIEVLQESLTLYRRLAEDRPDLFGSTLASNLLNLASLFRQAGREGEARTAAVESLALLRPMTERAMVLDSSQAIAMLRQYLEIADDLGIEPPAGLLDILQPSMLWDQPGDDA